MYDLELVLEDLRHVAWSLDQIEKRFLLDKIWDNSKDDIYNEYSKGDAPG